MYGDVCALEKRIHFPMNKESNTFLLMVLDLNLYFKCMIISREEASHCNMIINNKCDFHIYIFTSQSNLV